MLEATSADGEFARGEAEISVRPERVRLGPAGQHDPGEVNRLAGTIAEVIYMGRLRKYIVDLAEPIAAMSALVQVRGAGDPVYTVGDRVTLAWDAADATVVAHRSLPGETVPMPHAHVGGTDIHYVSEGAGPPILLIHGVGARLENWDGVAERLGKTFRLIRLDLRGHGRSARAQGPYSLDLFARDALGLLDLLGISRCRIAGHSLGGLITQYIAVRHPERANAIALLSTASGRSPEEQKKVEARVELIANGISGDHFRNSVSRWFTDEFITANPDLIARYAARNAENDPACYAAAYRVLATSDLAGELDAIRHPTLIVTGEHDRGSNPEMARLMHRGISNSELHVIPRLKHSILIEAPEIVAGLLDDFFTRHGDEPAIR